jgi:hypothetical protein
LHCPPDILHNIHALDDFETVEALGIVKHFGHIDSFPRECVDVDGSFGGAICLGLATLGLTGQASLGQLSFAIGRHGEGGEVVRCGRLMVVRWGCTLPEHVKNWRHGIFKMGLKI